MQLSEYNLLLTGAVATYSVERREEVGIFFNVNMGTQVRALESCAANDGAV